MLFQSYNFKQHLGYGYIANLLHFCKHGGNARGMASLGVQILGIDSVTSRIFKDPEMCKCLTNALKEIVGELIETQAEE